jgi:hypothetical protein
MTINTTEVPFYTIYTNRSAIVLYLENGLDYSTGRFISTQPNYQVACDIALELARQKGLTFINQVPEAHNQQRSPLL